jgi:hypothetical protein
MFCISEAQAAVIRTAFEQRGELSAVVELRRLFPGVGNIACARECVRTIADWQEAGRPTDAPIGYSTKLTSHLPSTVMK